MQPPTSPAPSMPRRHTAPDANKITKKASPRNTKAWTLEDERALLQGRLERIPYKQIGARIGKTDLACRLHFHQMVMAKRTPETLPGRSIFFLSSEHPPEVHRLGPTQPASNPSLVLPSIYATSNELPVSGAVHLGDRSAGGGHQGPFHRRSHSSPHALHNASPVGSWQPVEPPYGNHQFPQQRPDPVDLGRLNNIYRAHAGDFWSTIAAKYSGATSLSPSQLEKAFLHAQSVEDSASPSPNLSLAPSETPEITFTMSEEPSPNLTQHRSFRHVRSSSDMSIAGRCSVESLLNHGRM